MVFFGGSSVLRKWSFVIFLCLNRLSQEQYRTSCRKCSISGALSSAVIVTWQLKLESSGNFSLLSGDKFNYIVTV